MSKINFSNFLSNNPDVMRVFNNVQVDMENNSKNSINMDNIKLYHYQLPKSGYCFYNFEGVSLDDSLAGYIIVNLNDVFYPSNLKKFFYSSTEDERVLNYNLNYYKSFFKNIETFKNKKYEIIYYLSATNYIDFSKDMDESIKNNLTRKCKKLYKHITTNYVDNINILISYQNDKFDIRCKNFNEFIDNYLKYRKKYISINYENNKYLIGYSGKIDIKNINSYKNVNFLSCFVNGFKMIDINVFKESKSEYVFKYIENKQYKDFVEQFKGNHAEFKNTVIESLNHNRDNLSKFFNTAINKHTKGNNFMVIGLNLDYKYDKKVLDNMKLIFPSFKENLNKKKGGGFEFMMLSNFMSSTDNIVKRKIEIMDYENKSNNIEDYILKMMESDILIITGLSLTEEKLRTLTDEMLEYEDAVELIAGNKADRIFFNFTLNKTFRSVLAISQYYENFKDDNGITNKNKHKYRNNINNYNKLLKFLNIIKNRDTSTNKKRKPMVKKCKCFQSDDVYSYDFKYIPFITKKNTESLSEMEWDLI